MGGKKLPEKKCVDFAVLVYFPLLVYVLHNRDHITMERGITTTAAAGKKILHACCLFA